MLFFPSGGISIGHMFPQNRQLPHFQRHLPTSRHPRTTVLAAIAIIFALAVPALAQTPDEIRRQYDDALKQLRAAQDRKNELAVANEKLEKQLAAANAEVNRLQTDNAVLAAAAAGVAEKTYQLRARSAALDAFLKTHPDVKTRWDAFIAAPAALALAASAANSLPDWYPASWVQ